MFLRSGKRKRVAKPKPSNIRPKVKMPKKKKKMAVAPEELKLTGLIDDCLEHVFGYLNATDLTNVAEAHPQFVPSARLAYKRKYATKTVRIFNSGLGLSVQDERIAATVTVFMEHFGCVLQSLSLDYSFTEDPNDHFWREIERNIFKHCTKTLTRIELKHCRVNVMEEIRKPFENVAKLKVTSGSVDQNSIRLSKSFPNTKGLELNDVVIQDPDGISETFLFLIAVRLRNLRTVDGTTETVARRFIQSHRRIRILSIDFENVTCSPEFMLFLSTTLTRLEYLTMRKVQFSSVETHTNIHFKLLKAFGLQFQSNGRMPSNVSISFDQLNELGLYRVDAADPMWRDFILSNHNLTWLIFGPTRIMSTADWLQIVRNLPKLNKLEIRANAMSPDDMITFLKSWHPSDKFEELQLFTTKENRLEEYHSAIDANFKKIFQKTIKFDVVHRLILRPIRF